MYDAANRCNICKNWRTIAACLMEAEMSATRGKLQEAKYFLQRMEEVQADRAAFKYNLSAFLSAGRSVSFYMQKEFKRTPGFEEWYAAEQGKMRRDGYPTLCTSLY
jgi:hypothetical protein